MAPIRRLKLLPENEMDKLFGDVEIIVDISAIMLDKLETRIQQWFVGIPPFGLRSHSLHLSSWPGLLSSDLVTFSEILPRS